MTAVPESDEGPLLVADAAQRRLAWWCCAPPVVLFLAAIALAVFTDVLDGPAVGPLSWAYVVAVGQFVIAIACGQLYLSLVERRAQTGADARRPGRPDGDPVP